MHRPIQSRARHDRLYVFSQFVGWGGLTLIFIVMGFLYKGMTVEEMSVWVGSNCAGLLLSHLYRAMIHRLDWKQLNWPTLLPRVFLAVLLISVLWALVDQVFYLISPDVHSQAKVGKIVLLVYSVFNGVWILLIWSLLYFGYHMADRYRRSELARAELQAIVKESELQALKSQVNPHFIFNALNSMRALIDEEPGRAREAVTQLANLLRYSLQSGKLETVPFSEELRIVNDYLALEQVRHEDRLKVKLDIDPGALGLPIPPMILQTLVENAVKYGISMRTEGGEISIIARSDASGLSLLVINPGELRPQGDTPPHIISRDSTGLGLRNAAQRLQLLFGEGASLVLKEDGSGNVVAEVRTPKNLIKVNSAPSA